MGQGASAKSSSKPGGSRPRWNRMGGKVTSYEGTGAGAVHQGQGGNEDEDEARDDSELMRSDATKLGGSLGHSQGAHGVRQARAEPKDQLGSDVDRSLTDDEGEGEGGGGEEERRVVRRTAEEPRWNGFLGPRASGIMEKGRQHSRPSMQPRAFGGIIARGKKKPGNKSRQHRVVHSHYEGHSHGDGRDEDDEEGYGALGAGHGTATSLTMNVSKADTASLVPYNDNSTISSLADGSSRGMGVGAKSREHSLPVGAGESGYAGASHGGMHQSPDAHDQMLAHGREEEIDIATGHGAPQPDVVRHDLALVAAAVGGDRGSVGSSTLNAPGGSIVIEPAGGYKGQGQDRAGRGQQQKGGLYLADDRSGAAGRGQKKQQKQDRTTTRMRP